MVTVVGRLHSVKGVPVTGTADRGWRSRANLEKRKAAAASGPEADVGAGRRKIGARGRRRLEKPRLLELHQVLGVEGLAFL
ncbi:MAG: hypothetical protein ABEJ97_03560, partial [Halobellus sp.]